MKKKMKYLVLFVITLFFIELGSLAVYLIVNGKIFSFKRIDRKRERVILQSRETGDLKVGGRRVPWNVSIHPYFGFGKPVGFNFLEETNDNQNIIV